VRQPLCGVKVIIYFHVRYGGKCEVSMLASAHLLLLT